MSREHLRKLSVASVAIAGLVLLLMVLQGTLGGHKVQPGNVAISTPPLLEGMRKAQVVRRETDDLMTWPGTVQAHNYAELAPKLMGRILEVRVVVGDTVKTGQVLAVLDDRDLRARLNEARAALIAAQAQATEAAADEQRTRRLFDKQAATAQELEAAVARGQSGRAAVAQAKSKVTETEVLLSENLITAPFPGKVVRRLADPGQMGLPGRPILTVQESARLKFLAQVPASCAQALVVGQSLEVRVEAQELPAQIEELAPAADPQSRTIAVKLSLPEAAATRPGSFGRLIQACGRHEALLIPTEAVVRIGQLEQVQVLTDDGPRRRLIRTGKTYEREIEVLSGLKEGETVLLAQVTE